MTASAVSGAGKPNSRKQQKQLQQEQQQYFQQPHQQHQPQNFRRRLTGRPKITARSRNYDREAVRARAQERERERERQREELARIPDSCIPKPFPGDPELASIFKFSSAAANLAFEAAMPPVMLKRARYNIAKGGSATAPNSKPPASQSATGNDGSSNHDDEETDDHPDVAPGSISPCGLIAPRITLTIYIPTAFVGTVVGKGGATIASLQQKAQIQAANGGGTLPPQVHIRIAIRPPFPVRDTNSRLAAAFAFATANATNRTAAAVPVTPGVGLNAVGGQMYYAPGNEYAAGLMPNDHLSSALVAASAFAPNDPALASSIATVNAGNGLHASNAVGSFQPHTAGADTGISTVTGAGTAATHDPTPKPNNRPNIIDLEEQLSNYSQHQVILLARQNNQFSSVYDYNVDIPTYSPLDFSSPYWTPIVLHGDPASTFFIAKKIEGLVDRMVDEVVVDVPLSQTKHANVIGKRGLTLAHLSADSNVRIMVPQRQVRHDMIQLEGDVGNVISCCERILQLTATSTMSFFHVTDYIVGPIRERLAAAATSTSHAGSNTNSEAASATNNSANREADGKGGSSQQLNNAGNNATRTSQQSQASQTPGNPKSTAAKGKATNGGETTAPRTPQGKREAMSANATNAAASMPAQSSGKAQTKPASPPKPPAPKKSSTIIVLTLMPSANKLRTISRRTDTTIRKKKRDETSWNFTITGSNDSSVRSAVHMLQKWIEDARRNANNAATAGGGGGSNGKNRGNNVNNNNNNGNANNKRRNNNKVKDKQQQQQDVDGGP